MTAGIVVDDYKLDTFKTGLDQAGFEYEIFPGPAKGMTLLQVETEDLKALHRVIRTCDAQARRKKR